MADYGASYTDAELKKLEKKIGVVYKQAEADLNKKIKDFNNKYKAKETKHLKELAAGKITQEQFDSWKAGQVFQGKQWQAKKDQIANTLFHANETATKIMNGQMTNVFAVNANFMSYSLEKNAGVNFGFGLYDSATVSNLLKADQKLLPEWKINEKKDYTWNNKRVNRVVTQGIIQGEKLDQIADRLCDRLITQNKNKMLTFARTSMTCAQNAGREYSLNAAKDLGINAEKEWMCTLDGRTRDWHRMLDGQKQPLDKPFEVDGLKIRYPGDPEAEPGLVYNCRCTMVGDIVDYPSTYDRYDNIDGKPIKGMTYQEWEAAKLKGENISPIPLTWKKFVEQNTQTVNIKDLFADKKMSHVYNDIEAFDTTTANKFYKELQGMGKPSQIWNSYIDGTLDEANTKKLEAFLEKYLKAVDKNKTIVDDVATGVAKTVKKVKPTGDPLIDAQNELKAAEEALQKSGINNKTFSGIWKDDVTYADYEAKKASIAAKKKYYEDGIAAYKNLDPKLYSSQIAQYEKYLKDLKDFEENGKKYSKYSKAINDAKAKVKKLSPKVSNGQQFADDAFDAATKKSAKNFTNKKAADQFHRKYLDSVWDDLTDEEKYGIWEYTRNSNPMNKSLSGYHDGWSRSNFIGPLKTDWGHEDSWRSLPSAFKKYGKGGNVTYHKAITDTTKAIEKSLLPDGVMLVRGSDNNGFAGMIEGSNFTFDQAKKLLNSGNPDKIKKALEGQVIQNHAFTSTGIASGTGFSGEVSYKIYAPKGTKAIYAEPQSYFGNTVGSKAKLYKTGQSYSSIGNEAEVILQRGTKFRITKIESTGYRTTVHMEVVEQPNYFKFGDEDTFNGGVTRHKK